MFCIHNRLLVVNLVSTHFFQYSKVKQLVVLLLDVLQVDQYLFARLFHDFLAIPKTNSVFLFK